MGAPGRRIETDLDLTIRHRKCFTWSFSLFTCQDIVSEILCANRDKSLIFKICGGGGGGGILKCYIGIPVATGKQGSHSDWKTWKNQKAFSSQGKVGEFWSDWKSQGKSHKILENEKISDKYYLIFSAIFSLTVYYLLKHIKFSVWNTKQ